MTGLLGGGSSGGVDIPTRQAATVTKTAERVDTGGSEAARRRRQRRQASVLTRDFAPAQLGVSGLTGVV